jgi:hypothetical protein
MKKRITVYWLIPAEPERELFRNVIRILVKQFDAASFAPHLTLCAAENPRSTTKVLRQIRNGPIRLRVRGIGHSSKFTRTLFVEFTASKALGRLVDGLGGNSKQLKDPHLSLLYKELPARTRRELAMAMKLPFRDVVFDRIKAANCVSPTKTRRDVESWRTVANKRLSG